ncbi:MULTISPECIES: hypothetical protein [unclassified Nonomuraea]|uniref:hypothetical protein n=1 Tax=unclassified Nonomuraea TaxID=2593643 RepID=UPI0035C2663D
MHIRRATMAGLLAALTLGGLVPAETAQARRLYDFGAQGVIIWSEPRAGSGRNGLGYAGQGFEANRSEEHGLYRCDNFESTLWHHGRNVTTGVVGWVPACNLADPD